jgi:hypothetical protein
MIIMFILIPTRLEAQSLAFIQGKIIDRETREPLPAYVSIKGTDIGTAADYDGTFKITVDTGANSKTVILEVSQIGYKKKEVETRIADNILIELELEPLLAYNVIVTADSLVSEDRTQKTVTLKKMDIYSLPGTAADPIYASQVLPGVNSFPDSSSLLIRGGSPEEVAYYLDGIEIAHPSLSSSLHESYFSIFDNQVIDGFSVSTSGFQAKFGDVLSGVMDIKTKTSISSPEGGIGLSILGSNGYVATPIKEVGSFIGSFNWGNSALMNWINNREESQFKSSNGFGKAELNLNKATRLTILATDDRYDFSDDSGFSTIAKNMITGFSFTSSLAPNLVTTFTFSGVRHHAFFEIDDLFQQDFVDKAIQAREDTSLDLGRHYLEFGADVQRRTLDFSLKADGNSAEKYNAGGTRGGFYLSDKFRVTDKFYLILGGRLSLLSLNGTELNFDPRLSLAYFITRKDILRLSASSHHQYGDYFTLKVHPLKAKRASHLSLTYDRISDNLNLRLTLYDKEYRNLFLYEENEVSNNGLGFARGAETFIKWVRPKYDLVFVYNFLSSKRKENDVQFLTTSPYEITNSFTGIITYKFRTGTLGLRVSYATGMPYTPLVGREWNEDDQNFIPVWGDPYSERYPSYQRVDFNGTKTFAIKKRLVVLYFGIMNLLGRNNVLRYEYSSDYSLQSSDYSIFGRSFFIGIYVPFF